MRLAEAKKRGKLFIAGAFGVPRWWVDEAYPYLSHVSSADLRKNGVPAPTRLDAWLPECVYFVEVVANGPIKIGVTKQGVEKRLANLQIACPYELRLMMTLPLEDGLEELLHRQFSSGRLRGEWFERSEHLMQYVIDRYEGIRSGKLEATSSVSGTPLGVGLGFDFTKAAREIDCLLGDLPAKP